METKMQPALRAHIERCIMVCERETGITDPWEMADWVILQLDESWPEHGRNEDDVFEVALALLDSGKKEVAQS